MPFKPRFEIEGRAIGEAEPCFVIAEAGVSHFGDLQKAFSLVDLAKVAGSDAVKFQIFDVDKLISAGSEEWKMRLGPRALPYDAFKDIQDYCNQVGIIFLATAHEDDALDFLISMEVPAFKIGSGELGNVQYIEKVLAQNKPVILSTGMYTEEDVDNVVALAEDSGNQDVALLHCVTSYPTEPRDVNLRVIQEYKRKYGCISGYSDHTEGIQIPLAAVAIGAGVLEKHISLDFNVPNAQDWKVSCGPSDLPELLKQIRTIEAAVGDGKKVPLRKEQENQQWARKSLVFQRRLNAGDEICSEDLIAKRPGYGITPAQIDDVIGRRVNTTVNRDDLVSWDALV